MIEHNSAGSDDSTALEDFHRDGFMVVPVHDADQINVIRAFTIDHVRQLIADSAGCGVESLPPINRYHEWWRKQGIDHSSILTARNRHLRPADSLRSVILSDGLKEIADRLLPMRWRLWDEGLGWLAFRLIRPGMNDGYPPSRKEWGPAKSVVSCWIPVIGHGPQETLAILPGSHKHEYERYLPDDSKFMKGEYRLRDAPPLSEFFRPQLAEGEIIIYHPRLIHSEDVEQSDTTRLNLEIRLQPADVPGPDPDAHS
jgi:hypothetical protein